MTAPHVLITHAVEGLARLSSNGTPDASDVKPGWVAFVIVVVLCVATTLLWLNMRKQLGKIRFEEQDVPARSGARSGARRGGGSPDGEA